MEASLSKLRSNGSDEERVRFGDRAGSRCFRDMHKTSLRTRKTFTQSRKIETTFEVSRKHGSLCYVQNYSVFL